jgi:hypothetical protein
MIPEAQARSFAVSAFPKAPEKLAKYLGVDVRLSPLSGCDGWCLVKGEKAIVHVNSKLSRVRQRFTLAHELGHLILGVPSVIGETYEDFGRRAKGEPPRVGVANPGGGRSGVPTRTPGCHRRTSEAGETSESIRTGCCCSSLQFGSTDRTDQCLGRVRRNRVSGSPGTKLEQSSRGNYLEMILACVRD